MSLKPYHKDDDGMATRAGDIISFSYGIPPAYVKAEIINRNGTLIALTPGHNPPECKLKELRGFVGGWYRHGRKETTP